jgi:circadian clock protein KaiC
MDRRVPTGIYGFDELIEDGFPSESIILVAGNAGAGKTTFAAQFIYEGVKKLGEKGLYVCFSETKSSFIRAMLRFGWDFDKLEKDGSIMLLDLSTTKEPGIQSNLNIILEKISEMNVKRLVIDSFSAFSMSLTELADIRFLIHLLYRFLQKVGCTTIMIADSPWGSQRIGSGVEEFIADGIVLMQSRFNGDGDLKRTLRIIKMRSTIHSKKSHEYEISDEGIKIRRKEDSS